MNTKAPENAATTGAPTRKYTFWSNVDPLTLGEHPALPTLERYESGLMPSSTYESVPMGTEGLNSLFAALKCAGGENALWLDREVFQWQTIPALSASALLSARQVLIDHGKEISIKQIHGDAIDAKWAPAIFLSHNEFHSPAISELLDIELMLGSVKRVIAEALELVFKRASSIQSALAGESEDDVESTGLAFTDDAADYPAAPRNYADVKVRISGTDRIKPRRYSNEDHQVWGT